MIGKNMKVGALVFGLALGGGVLAGSVLGAPGTTSAASAVAAAATTATDASTDSSTTSGQASANPETPLTGDVAAQVTAAAQAAVPDGTIDRVETDNDGVYEAHMTKADGTQVVVQVGADFTVTATIDQPQGGRGGHGGPGNGETLLTGDTATSVTAAAQAAVPDGTILRVETDSDGSPYEAHVTKADGTEVVVKVDAGFAVTGIEDMPAGGGGRHHGQPSTDSSTTDSTASTTAFVSG